MSDANSNGIADAGAGEDTPLVSNVGKKVDVVVKDEHEKADVTATAVTDEGTCWLASMLCWLVNAFFSSFFKLMDAWILLDWNEAFVIVCPFIMFSSHPSHSHLCMAARSIILLNDQHLFDKYV